MSEIAAPAAAPAATTVGPADGAGGPSTSAAPSATPTPSEQAPEGSQEAAAAPEKPDLAAEVIKRRGAEAASLARLMREKREIEAQAAKLAERGPALDVLERARKYAEEGDHARATRTFYEAIHGPEKAKELFPQVYESLTSEVLGVESASKVQSRVERDLARLQQQQEALEQKIARDQAAYEQWAAANREERITGAVQTISQMLDAATDDYPYLLAESDDPAQVVWEILVEAAERGEEPPTPEEAARLANAHFQPLFEKKKTRYQNLLAPQSASDSFKPETPNSQSGTSRKSLTNADAAEAPDLKVSPTIADRDQSIDAAWRMLQERSRQT